MDATNPPADSIDITPTWQGTLPALLAVYTYGETLESRKIAEQELRRMAQAADYYVAICKRSVGNPVTYPVDDPDASWNLPK